MHDMDYNVLEAVKAGSQRFRDIQKKLKEDVDTLYESLNRLERTGHVVYSRRKGLYIQGPGITPSNRPSIREMPGTGRGSPDVQHERIHNIAVDEVVLMAVMDGFHSVATIQKETELHLREISQSLQRLEHDGLVAVEIVHDTTGMQIAVSTVTPRHHMEARIRRKAAGMALAWERMMDAMKNDDEDSLRRMLEDNTESLQAMTTLGIADADTMRTMLRSAGMDIEIPDAEKHDGARFEDPMTPVVLNAILDGHDDAFKINEITRVTPRRLKWILSILYMEGLIRLDTHKRTVRITAEGRIALASHTHRMEEIWGRMARDHQKHDRDGLRNTLQDNAHLLPAIISMGIADEKIFKEIQSEYGIMPPGHRKHGSRLEYDMSLGL